MVERYRREPVAGARAMLLEATARRLNERQTLVAGSSVAQMVREAGLTSVEDEFRRVFAESGFAVYDVRRVTPAGMDGRRGVTARSVRRLATGPEGAMDAYLADSPGQRVVGADRIVRHHLPAGPGCEHFRVVAPAVVEDKQRKGFDRIWANVNSPSLF